MKTFNKSILTAVQISLLLAGLLTQFVPPASALSACEKFETYAAVRIYIQGNMEAGSETISKTDGYRIEALSDGKGACGGKWNEYVMRKREYYEDYYRNKDRKDLAPSVEFRQGQYVFCFTNEIETLRQMVSPPSWISPNVDKVLLGDGIIDYHSFKKAYKAAKKACEN